MQGHRPQEAFTPVVEKALGKGNVIVVQDALEGNRFSDGLRTGNRQREKNPNDRGFVPPLNWQSEFEIKGEKLKTVTFIWMQGERDAKMLWGPVYEASLLGLHAQLSADLKRTDIDFVIAGSVILI